jgi:hypothetical protein
MERPSPLVSTKGSHSPFRAAACAPRTRCESSARRNCIRDGSGRASSSSTRAARRARPLFYPIRCAASAVGGATSASAAPEWVSGQCRDEPPAGEGEFAPLSLGPLQIYPPVLLAPMVRQPAVPEY